jgi:ATP-dependent Lon protease
MNGNSDDQDDLRLPPEQDIASTGAAADSAEYDDGLKGLPRLLRYAILSQQDGKFAKQRLVAEIAELVPDHPLTLSWMIQDAAPSYGVALAIELDHLAVTQDKPDLRSLGDCVRLLSLSMSDVVAGRYDHVRVAKALMLAWRQLPNHADLKLAAKIEAFCIGWSVLPMMSDVLARFNYQLASTNAQAIGRTTAKWRIETALARLRRQHAEQEEERREGSGRSNSATALTDNGAVPDDHIVVCRLDEDSAGNPKMRELIKPLRSVINTALPLVLTPPLDAARRALMSEFPYAEAVIDFALADLAGRRTIRLSPLLLVGPAGGGKSRFARRLGEALSLGVWRTDASRSDGAAFGGTDKRWYSAEPCHPFLAIAQSKQANPAVLIDEIEKAATRTDYGRFWDCLLGFLETETAARYPDPALQTNLDLSHVSYVATANGLDSLPSQIRDRFRIISFPEPAAPDLEALMPAIIADLVRERGLDSRWIEPFTRSEHKLVAACWSGGSVRQLRRVIDAVLRARDKTAVRH